jgi:hypothetical protein
MLLHWTIVVMSLLITKEKYFSHISRIIINTIIIIITKSCLDGEIINFSFYNYMLSRIPSLQFVSQVLD